MKSQREIQREYNKLLQDVATKDFYKVDLTNRVNCYVCQSCHAITKTIDVDSGVTPFIHLCENCNGEAHSTFYKDIVPNRQPTQEWYRPSLKEVLKMRNKEGMLEHILQGGLDVRLISKP
jgi:RNase P subunit RPR2